MYYKRTSASIEASTLRRVSNLNGLFCSRAGNVDGASFTEGLFGNQLAAIMAATGDLTVSTDDPLWTNLGTGSILYMGNAATPEHNLKPRHRNREWRRKSTLTHEVFAQRLAANDIVFNNYAVGTATIVEQPGFDAKDLTPSGTTARRPNIFQLNPSLPIALICDGESWPRFVLDENEIGTAVQYPPNSMSEGVRSAFYRYNLTYDRFLVRPGAVAAYPFAHTPSLPAAIDSFLEELQVPKPIPGLVTSVHCEANKGAWDALTSLMENLRETLPMIFRALQQALDLQASARGKIKHRRSLSQGNIVSDIASIWMWYRYAVTPLALDIQNLLDYLETESVEFQSYRKGRASSRRFEHKGWTGEVEIMDRCLVRHRYDFSYFHGLSVSVPRTAWELLPTRYITDWFVNVGNVLSASSPPRHANLIKMQYSTRCQSVLRLTHPDHPGVVTVDIDSYARSTNHKQSFIDIEYRPNLTWKRYADALALFWGNLKSPHRFR